MTGAVGCVTGAVVVVGAAEVEVVTSVEEGAVVVVVVLDVVVLRVGWMTTAVGVVVADGPAYG